MPKIYYLTLFLMIRVRGTALGGGRRVNILSASRRIEACFRGAAQDLHQLTYASGLGTIVVPPASQHE